MGGGEDPGRQPEGVCHQTQSKRQQYHGAKCTLIDSLVQFDYSEHILKGHSQVQRGKTHSVGEFSTVQLL